jgi:hypothetical protein
LRAEVSTARIGRVLVVGGDTPDSVATGWVRGHIISVRKAFRPDWNDGSPNAGYFWELGIVQLRPEAIDVRSWFMRPELVSAIGRRL